MMQGPMPAAGLMLNAAELGKAVEELCAQAWLRLSLLVVGTGLTQFVTSCNGQTWWHQDAVTAQLNARDGGTQNE